MARKQAADLEGVRSDIKKRYKQAGTKSRREIVSFESLSDQEKWLAKERMALLKAAGFSYTYIAEACDMTRGTVKKLFQEDPEIAKRVAEFQQDFIDGAVKLVKTYTIEIFEMLMEIARDKQIDPKTRITAMTEMLDRAGLAKVNKSQSEVTKKNQVDITDKTGILAAMESASPEAQQAMAEKLEQALAIASEHTDKDVTHA